MVDRLVCVDIIGVSKVVVVVKVIVVEFCVIWI